MAWFLPDAFVSNNPCEALNVSIWVPNFMPEQENCSSYPKLQG